MSTKNKILAAGAAVLIAGAAYIVGAGFTLVPRTASAAPALYSQDAVTSIYNSASPAVFEITVTEQGTGRSVTEGQGSGFLIDNQGHILTNNHVISGASNIQVMLKGGNTVAGKVVGTDAIDDLAIISVDTSAVSNLTPLQFDDSSAVVPGEMAIAIGSPYGLTNSVSVGIISGLDRSLSSSTSASMTGMLQTDAALNPGNSGGPLLDAGGNVIGINTAIESTTGARGIGFAVPSNTATKALSSLLAGKQVTRPWLGISGTALTQTQAGNLGLSVNQGVYVVAVVSGSPADKAGLKAGGSDSSGAPTAGGDVITAIDGNSVTSVQELSAYINTKQPGDTVSLSVIRGGQAINIQVTLGTWPDQISSGTVPQTTPAPSVPRGGNGRFRLFPIP